MSKFCCLSLVDMTGSAGCAEKASTARMGREWVIVLTTVSLQHRFQCVMLYGSETIGREGGRYLHRLERA